MKYEARIEERTSKNGKIYFVFVVEFDNGAQIQLFPSFDQQQLISTLMML